MGEGAQAWIRVGAEMQGNRERVAMPVACGVASQAAIMELRLASMRWRLHRGKIPPGLQLDRPAGVRQLRTRRESVMLLVTLRIQSVKPAYAPVCCLHLITCRDSKQTYSTAYCSLHKWRRSPLLAHRRKFVSAHQMFQRSRSELRSALVCCYLHFLQD
jgi:hypothetical protein